MILRDRRAADVSRSPVSVLRVRTLTFVHSAKLRYVSSRIVIIIEFSFGHSFETLTGSYSLFRLSKDTVSEAWHFLKSFISNNLQNVLRICLMNILSSRNHKTWLDGNILSERTYHVNVTTQAIISKSRRRHFTFMLTGVNLSSSWLFKWC